MQFSKKNTYTASAVVAPLFYSQLSFNYPSLLRAVRNFVSRASGAVSIHNLEARFNIIVDAPVYPWPNKHYYEFQHYFSLPFSALTPDQRQYCDKYRALHQREQRKWKNFKRFERNEKVAYCDIQMEASLLEFDKNAREALLTLELNSKALEETQLVYQRVSERIEQLQSSLELIRDSINAADVISSEDTADAISSEDPTDGIVASGEAFDEFGWPIEIKSTRVCHGDSQKWESLLTILGLSLGDLPENLRVYPLEYG